MTGPTKTVGLVGARGHVGEELLALIARHSGLDLAFASSRALAGQPVPGAPGKVFDVTTPADMGKQDVDIVVLAMPNGLARDYVDALSSKSVVILDLSADYRFDDDWAYGLPEITPVAPGETRISNPGCYATAMQLALAPLVPYLDGPPACFGVSGYSGAGTAPSDKNDPALLRDNLLSYAPVGHTHEREVSRHLGHDVDFMPHVASFFRGISMTVNARLQKPLTADVIVEAYSGYYAGSPLIRLSEQAPRVADNAGEHHATIGGWQLGADGQRIVVYATLDNLLKGAATQAIQNLNSACGFAEMEGISNAELHLAEQTA